jgi:predicted ATPase
MDGLFFATELHLMKDVEKMLGDALIARRADKKIATLFREIYGLEMEGLSFGKPGLLMALFPSEGVRIDDLGAGMRISIRLMILLMSMRKTALLLEEFDAYQFPESLETLARILVRSAKESEMQIIMTTHSMESIRSFLAACNLEGIPDFRLFPLVRTKDGTLRTKALSLDATQELAAAGFDLRTLGSNE